MRTFTTALAVLAAELLPAVFVAVSFTRTVEPTSAPTNRYEEPVAAGNINAIRATSITTLPLITHRRNRTPQPGALRHTHRLPLHRRPRHHRQLRIHRRTRRRTHNSGGRARSRTAPRRIRRRLVHPHRRTNVSPNQQIRRASRSRQYQRNSRHHHHNAATDHSPSEPDSPTRRPAPHSPSAPAPPTPTPPATRIHRRTRRRLTTAVAVLAAELLPAVFVAVSFTRTVEPTSAPTNRYEEPVAPAISTQFAPPPSQRCH